MNHVIINIDKLSKTFDKNEVLKGLCFNVFENEIFGLVGPDGAGKSTLIKILCGLAGFDSGNVSILGNDLKKNRNKIKKQIGYLSQKFSLYQDLTIDENIEFIAKIHGVRHFQSQRNELLDFMRLTKFRHFLAGQLSGGMKQKLALACALIHKPKIIFLDEPTTGVDPVSRRDFWKILSGLLKEKLTIVISTPYLDEAERFSRIALIDEGMLLRCGSPIEIKSEMKKQVLEIICDNLRYVNSILKKYTEFEIQMFGDRIDIVFNDYESEMEILKQVLNSNNVEIKEYRLKPVSLENVFINLLDKKQ